MLDIILITLGVLFGLFVQLIILGIISALVLSSKISQYEEHHNVGKR